MCVCAYEHISFSDNTTQHFRKQILLKITTNLPLFFTLLTWTFEPPTSMRPIYTDQHQEAVFTWPLFILNQLRLSTASLYRPTESIFPMPSNFFLIKKKNKSLSWTFTQSTSYMPINADRGVLLHFRLEGSLMESQGCVTSAILLWGRAAIHSMQLWRL